jgi:hypothetical protein
MWGKRFPVMKGHFLSLSEKGTQLAMMMNSLCGLNARPVLYMMKIYRLVFLRRQRLLKRLM